jgi:uncharacterized protein (DUF433 family)
LLAPYRGVNIASMSSNVVHVDPEIMGGTPVFKGTRVPIGTFFDYVGGGEPLSEFFQDFPTVTQSQVLQLLEEVKGEIIPSAKAS